MLKIESDVAIAKFWFKYLIQVYLMYVGYFKSHHIIYLDLKPQSVLNIELHC